MIITFDELRKIKDNLPPGSMQKIADQLNIDVETVRNFFGSDHYDRGGQTAGIHMEKGVNGGYVHIDNPEILEAARQLLLTQQTTV
jgi:hypothetical protein